MIIFQQAQPLQQHLAQQRQAGLNIGFVPTMGALHPGHLSLVERSKNENALTVCSIFVNPTQFNNPDDFRHYPVTIEQDIELLLGQQCDVLFLPSVAEVYPPGYAAPHYALGAIEQRLEGAFRPGHFQGVCQVVDRLLQLVQPQRLYLGQKDFQQCMVLRKMLALTGRADSTGLVVCPTFRESDGLAMSSRNLRLSPEERALAPAIYRALLSIRAAVGKEGFDQLKQRATEQLNSQGFRVDYVEIAGAEDLAPASAATQNPVALVAAFLGAVRLIDNLPLN